MAIDKVSSPITSSPSTLLPGNVERSESSLARPTENPSSEHLGLSGRSQRAPDESVSRRFANAALSAVSTGATTLADLFGMSRRIATPGAGDIEAGIIRSESSLSVTTAQVQETSGVERPAAAVMSRLEKAISDAKSRPVDTQVAADLVNELRRMGPGAGKDRAATNDDLMKGVTDKHVDDWFKAQGLQGGDVKALRDAALYSGMPNPTGSFVNNAIQYIASPWTNFGASDKTNWGGAAVGFFAAGVGAPMNAFQQSAVVTLCESIREHGGPVIVPDKNNINDKHYLPELSKKFEIHVKEFSGAHDALQNTMKELGIASDTHLASKLESLDPAGKQKLQEQVGKLLVAETKLFDTQRDFMMTQGAHTRQWQGNKWQLIPRTARAPAGGMAGLLSKVAPKFVSPTAQTVASLVLTASQHVAAGFDERNKQEYNNKLNLMYGNFFTDAGNAKLKSGEALTADDIDKKKLLGFVNFPEQSLVKHVSAEVKRQIAGLKDLDGSSKTVTPRTDGAKDEAALKALVADEKKLKEGKLTELTPGGLAESLLVASEKSVFSQQLVADVKAKYTMREFSAQTAQRLGQMFHLGVAGSAASSVIGKVVTSASGGAKEAPTAQTVGISALSGAMAGFGARFQHTAISVKNNRREAEQDPGLVSQVKRGMWGAAGELSSNHKGEKTSQEMNGLLADKDIVQTLKFAKDVQGMLGTPQTKEEVSLSSPPRPGSPSQPGITEIAIEIPPESSSAAASKAPVLSPTDKGKRPMEEQ